MLKYRYWLKDFLHKDIRINLNIMETYKNLLTYLIWYVLYWLTVVPSIVTDALVLLEMTSTVKNFGLFSCNFNWFERWCVWGIVCWVMSAISEDHSKAACVQSIIIWIGNYYTITLLWIDAYIKLSFLKGRAKKNILRHHYTTW